MYLKAWVYLDIKVAVKVKGIANCFLQSTQESALSISWLLLGFLRVQAKA